MLINLISVLLITVIGIGAQIMTQPDYDVRPSNYQRARVCPDRPLRTYQLKRRPQKVMRSHKYPDKSSLGSSPPSHGSSSPSYGSSLPAQGSFYPSRGSSLPSHGCFPNILLQPARTNLLKKLATYYGYRYFSTNPTQLYNAESTYSFVPQGTVVLPDSLIHAVHCVSSHNVITLTETGQPQCFFEDSDILSTPAGVDYYFTFDKDHADPEYKVWYHLYDDPSPNGFEILYGCAKPNLQTGICRNPEVVVNTRAHPSSMSHQAKHKVDQIITRVLAPYCLSGRDMQPVIFSEEYASCEARPNPAFTKLVRGLKESLFQRPPTKYEPVPNHEQIYDLSAVPIFSSREPRPVPGPTKVASSYFPSEDRNDYNRGNQTLLGLDKLFSSNYHTKNRYDNINALPGLNKISNSYQHLDSHYPSGNRYDNISVLPGLDKISESRKHAANFKNQYDSSSMSGLNKTGRRKDFSKTSEDSSRDNSTLRGLDKLASLYYPTEVSEDSSRSNETLPGLNKIPNLYHHSKSEDSEGHYGNISALSGLDKISSSLGTSKNDESSDGKNNNALPVLNKLESPFMSY